MEENVRHAAYLDAQDKAYQYALEADVAGGCDRPTIDLANMWANVAQALRKDKP